ncbi:MAG: GNAT family N-acetyltransferase [Candidatus Pacebacteria bacterium]|nr:GNAT family N-acetyltransferase [Candidatus Paceibacterota bacterium]
MKNISYHRYQVEFKQKLIELIMNLYQEDQCGKPMSLEKIELTLKNLNKNPSMGEIILIKNDQQIIGYSILINFWSNEYGGNILTIDELYIEPNYRSKKIGTNFINYLKNTKYNQAVALQLETTPTNLRANSLYKNLGFEPAENSVMVMDI